jgi:hypothetical protein
MARTTAIRRIPGGSATHVLTRADIDATPDGIREMTAVYRFVIPVERERMSRRL